LGLVNCKFKSIQVPTDKAWAVPKYYLDVKVVNPDGSPVEGATVSVTNEQNNVDYPAENKESIKQLFRPNLASSDYDEFFYLSNQLIQGKPYSATVTGADGHTPLPADATNTLILADYVQDQDSITPFTYAVTAEKNGIKGSIRGVDPDSGWYREAEDVPVKTVVVTLGQETDLRLASDKPNLVYPNPYIRGKSQGEKITFGNLPPEAKIHIYTLGGAKVTALDYLEKMTGGSVTWDISRIAVGIYLYTITTNGAVVRRGKLSIIK